MDQPNHHQGLAMIPVKFPDAATCVVQPSEKNEIWECRNQWGMNCPHVILHDRKRFCLHPDAAAGLIRLDPKA